MLYSTPALAGSSAARITKAEYEVSEVIDFFQQLFDSFDFAHELQDMGISRLQILRRKKALRELKALCIAFWGLALEKSFPEDAEAFFSTYCAQSPIINNRSREAASIRASLDLYCSLLEEKKDADFSPIAAHLAEKLALNDADMRRLQLKLSLIMRSLYTTIFKHLV